jgi:hypothetical protein
MFKYTVCKSFCGDHSEHDTVLSELENIKLYLNPLNNLSSSRELGVAEKVG